MVRFNEEEAQRAKDKEEAEAKRLENGEEEPPVEAPAAGEEGEEGTAEPSEIRPPTAKAVPLTPEEEEFEEFLA